MKISLNQLLQTGQFGDLRADMSKREVEVLLGPPDDVGCEGVIYLYGTVELYFSKERFQKLLSVFWEPSIKGELRLTRNCQVEDCALTPNMTMRTATAYLQAQGIAFTHQPQWEQITLTETGVRITFHEGRFSSVWADLPRP